MTLKTLRAACKAICPDISVSTVPAELCSKPTWKIKTKYHAREVEALVVSLGLKVAHSCSEGSRYHWSDVYTVTE